MGERQIELKPDSQTVKHGSYHLNPWVKEKVKKDIDRMLLDVGLIVLVDEE